MRSLTSSFVVILTVSLTVLAGNFVPFNDASTDGGLKAVTTSANQANAVIDISIDGIFIENIEAEGELYSRLYWENSGVSGAIGEPEIPVYRLFLEIPFGAEVAVSMEEIHRLEFALTDLGAEGRIYPVQPPLEKVAGARNDFQLNTAFYSADRYSNPPVAEVDDYAIFRGHQIAVIAIRPLDYNPAQGKISIIDDLRLRFTFTGGDMNQTARSLERFNNPQFNSFIDALIANPGVFETDALISPIMYLVISADIPEYLAILEPLLEWKHSKGYHIHLVTTSETGSSANEIQDYILNAYYTWDIPPLYVLLVGDTPFIPNWVGQGIGSPATDLYYGDMDGVYYSLDLWVSRLSPGSPADLQNMANKILEYEQVLWTGNDDWEKHATFMASNDNWTVSEGTHNYVIGRYLDPLGYTSDRLYCHTYNATTAQVTNAFNQGRSQGTYSGHGGTTSWADGPPFSQGNVQALINTVYPFIQSYACLTGKYTVGECFGETWTRVPHGAIAFWGASVSSYWGEDDILEKRLYEGFYDNQFPGDTVNFSWINGMTDYGKLKFFEYYGNSGMTRRYFEMYNVLGDGSVDLWTDVPAQITVQHPPVVYLGTTEITVEVSGYPHWVMVCAYSTAEDEVWSSEYADAGGSVTLYFEPPSLPGEMVFVVTGHDVEPYIEAVQLIPEAGPYVVFESLEIDDAAGWNPNNLLDYDEEALLDMTLLNVGVENALGVNAVIRSADPLVTILDSTAYFGNIPANGLSIVPGAFRIALAPDAPDEYIIEFEIEAYTITESWTTGFEITAHSPIVTVLRVLVDDSIGGNGNMALDPGETADIEVFLLNEGTSPALEVLLVLSTSDPNIILNSTTGEYGVLEPDSSSSAVMNLTVSPSCPQNYDVEFECDISGEHSYAAEDEFSLTVGDILNIPTGPDNYGYSAYDINDAPILPDYDWIEIDPNLGGSGTEIVFTQDDQTFQFDLPFTFTYYGVDYNRYSVCGNGWIAMGETNITDYSNSSIPNSDGPPAMIAPFWEDLSPQNQGTVASYYDPVEHIFIVEFSGVRQYYPAGAIETFQVILYDPIHYETITGDGEIKFQYKRVSDPTECTVGIENYPQTDGLQYLYNDSYDLHAAPIDSAMAILFTTGRDAPELTINITPVNPPVIIPPEGGEFQYSLSIVNGGASTAIFDGWIEVVMPDSSLLGPLLLRTNISLAASASIIREMSQYVPAGAPAGIYTYWGRVGQHPSTVFSESSFTFEKTGFEGDYNGIGGWIISGWEDSGGELLTALPESYSLSQNYPNPFNPRTSFDFALPEANDVTIRVFDILGRQVGIILQSRLGPGEYTVHWNASEFAGGIYFIRMEAGDFERVIKAVLVK